MIKELAITDLTKFTDFTYWPMREIAEGEFECVMDGSENDISHYAVFGKHYLPGKGETAEWVADLSTLQDAMAYCLLLNQAVRGRVDDMTQYRLKKGDEG